jgi:hypothetical protein
MWTMRYDDREWGTIFSKDGKDILLISDVLGNDMSDETLNEYITTMCAALNEAGKAHAEKPNG